MARQIEEERSELERRHLALGYRPHWLGLEHLQLIRLKTIVWPIMKDSIVEVISTRQRTAGSISRLLVTSMLLTTVSSTGSSFNSCTANRS